MRSIPRPSPTHALAAIVAAASMFVACRSKPENSTRATRNPTPAASASEPAPADAAVAPETVDASTEARIPDEPLAGALFTRQVKAAFRVAGCGGDDSLLPAHVDRQLVETHCTILKSAYEEYKREWLAVAGPFIAKLRPAELPTTVVYPFGGGDLVSALATYPDATEITTISLEIAGDVRAIDQANNKRLATELAQLRDHLGKLFLKAHSRTQNLDVETHGAIPGEVAFTMAALVIHGFEPVTLRYFSFTRDGGIRWLTEEDIAKNKKEGMFGPFANAEIRFKKPGEPTVRVLRHVASDLSDATMRHAPLRKHLEAKGKVATMTKAASHLLWDDEHFSVIRHYLMTNTDWMISDTTGVPPRVAKKYGFVQDAYGTYEGAEPFGKVDHRDVMAFVELFKTAKPIPFRYGYPDNKSHGHIVVTRRPHLVAKP